MTISTAEFVDTTGGNFDDAPLVSGSWRAIYVTGSGSVPENQAEIDAAKAAGVRLILIDQQPGLPLFRQGKADVADVESLAATFADFASAVPARRQLGITTHTGYCSESPLPQLEAANADQTGIWYWVANYDWSAAQSISLLAAHSNWGATQFGSPTTNPTTLVPGTSVDLAQAQMDIDMGNLAWLNLFPTGGAPSPVPTPPPPPAPVAPAWPFGPLDYLGTPRGDSHCHSGYYSSVDAYVVRTWQQRMADRGWTITVDGHYGLNEVTLNQGQSPAVCEAFQREKGLKVDGLVGPITWAAAWTSPITIP